MDKLLRRVLFIEFARHFCTMQSLRQRALKVMRIILKLGTFFLRKITIRELMTRRRLLDDAQDVLFFPDKMKSFC